MELTLATNVLEMVLASRSRNSNRALAAPLTNKARRYGMIREGSSTSDDPMCTSLAHFPLGAETRLPLLWHGRGDSYSSSKVLFVFDTCTHSAVYCSALRLLSPSFRILSSFVNLVSAPGNALFTLCSISVNDGIPSLHVEFILQDQIVSPSFERKELVSIRREWG